MSGNRVTTQTGVFLGAEERAGGQCAIDPGEQTNIARRHLTERIAFALLWLTGVIAILVELLEARGSRISATRHGNVTCPFAPPRR